MVEYCSWNWICVLLRFGKTLLFSKSMTTWCKKHSTPTSWNSWRGFIPETCCTRNTGVPIQEFRMLNHRCRETKAWRDVNDSAAHWGAVHKKSLQFRNALLPTHYAGEGVGLGRCSKLALLRERLTQSYRWGRIQTLPELHNFNNVMSKTWHGKSGWLEWNGGWMNISFHFRRCVNGENLSSNSTRDCAAIGSTIRQRGFKPSM